MGSKKYPSVSSYQATTPGKRGVRWRFRLEAATSDGRRKQVGRGGFTTAKEAADALEAARATYAGVVDPTEATLRQYVDGWLEHRLAVGKIRPATADQYGDSLKLLGDERRLLRKPLRPTIAPHGNRRIRYAGLTSKTRSAV